MADSPIMTYHTSKNGFNLDVVVEILFPYFRATDFLIIAAYIF